MSATRPTTPALPLVFEPNQGQAAPQVQYLSRTAGYSLFLTSSEAVMVLGGTKNAGPSTVRMRLEQALPTVAGEALDRLPGVSNYFTSPDPKQWRTNIPQYGKVRYRSVYPGVDVVYYGSDHQMEYDFVVQPGADPHRIQLSFDGANRLSVNQAGDLVLQVAGRELVQRKPVIYQAARGGGRDRIEGRYVIGADHRVRLSIAQYDRNRTLVIDPTIVYSTYLGGGGSDQITGMASDASGNVYLAGTTDSTNLPATSGSYQSQNLSAFNAAFVAKLNASGTGLSYLTYLSGAGMASGAGIAVDANGNAFVTGTSTGAFPTTSGAYKAISAGGVFVAKLSPAGNSLLYSTGYDDGTAAPAAIAIDANGRAYIAGTAYPGIPVFPAGAALQSVSGGQSDAFVAAFKADGSGLLYSTYLGGIGYDNATNLAVDAAGQVTVLGETDSFNFPKTAGVVQSSLKGGSDAFIARLNASGTTLVFSTYLGGTGIDYASGLALDAAGDIYISGATRSSDFPTTSGVYQTSPGSSYLTKLNGAGSQLLFSTYFNPTGVYDFNVQKRAIAIDASGWIFVAGSVASGSPGVPVTPGALQSISGGFGDLFLMQFNSTGSALNYATYLGGSSDDMPTALAITSNGIVYLAGVTISGNFPTTPGSLQPAHMAGSEGFVVKIDMTTTACSYSLSLGSQSFTSSGGTGQFNVIAPANCPWSTSISDPFISITGGASGSGNGTITFSVPANTSIAARTATISIAGQTFTVSQAGAACSYNLGSTAASVTASGATNIVTVGSPAGCAWTATSNSSWINVVFGNAGSGNGVVQYTVGVNTGADRTGTMTIAGQTFTVTQTLGTCTFSLSSTGTSVGAGASTGTINVTSSLNACNWSTTSSAPWLSVTAGASGTGSGSVSYSIAPNTSSQTRTATLTIGGQVFTVTQAGAPCSYLIAGSSQVASGGGANGVTITPTPSDCSWTAASNAAWLSVNPLVGTGTTSVTYTAAANTSSQTRAGTLTVGGQPFTVTQAGVGCTFSINPNTASVPAAGGSAGTSVTASASDCGWSATSNAAWLNVTAGSSGSGGGPVSFSAAANPTSTARTGTFSVAGQVFTVIQAGAACTYSLNPSSATLPASGGAAGTTITMSPSGCPWSATANVPWLSVTSTGSTTANFSVAANTSTTLRSGTIMVAGQPFTVTQAGAAAPTVTLSTTADIALYDTFSSFSVSANSTTVQSRNITLSASTGAVGFTSAVSGSPQFLTIAPSSSTTPATITLSVTPAGLAAGSYTNIVTFMSGGASTSYTVALIVQPAASLGAKAGVYRASAGLILVDRNGDGSCCAGDLVGTMGQSGDLAVAGDWAGDGVKKIGIYRPSTGLFLLDVNNNGIFDAGDKALTLAAQPGDVPVVGDWAGTGVERAGVFRNGTWYLDTNGDGLFSGRAFLGQAGDIPLVGNWNGVGTKSKAGIYRPTAQNGQPGNFFLVDTNGDGQYTGGVDQPLFFLGQQGDLPLIGDWSGDGKTKVGIYRPVGAAGANPGLFILDQNGNFAWDGPAVDKALFFAPYLNGLSNSTSAQAGDVPVTGNWVPSYTPSAAGTAIGQGKTRTGIFRPSTGTFFLDATADGTYQGRAFLGQSGDVPIGAPMLSNGTVFGVNFLGNF